ncbi:MAG: hypothetical protein ACYSWU_00170 [Planctomycetota bacterium]|jgi:hypothetical protein
MKAETIQTEIDASISRLSNAAIIDQKAEFLGNVYPLLKLLAQSQAKLEKNVNERLDLCEGAVAEMITGSDDRIHQRLAARIQTTVALGMQLCEYATKGASPENPPEPELMMLIQTFRDSAAVMIQMVDDVLVEEEDEEEEEPDGSDDAKD